MSGIVGSKFNIRGSGLVGSLGTDGQHMLSSGAGKTNVFETPAAAGGMWTKILHQTITSATASMDFVDGTGGCVIDATYDYYLMHFRNAVLATADKKLLVLISDDTGSTWETTGYASFGYQAAYTGGQTARSAYNTSMTVMNAVTTTAGEGIAGYILFTSPALSIKPTCSYNVTMGANAVDAGFNWTGGGKYDTATAYDGIQFISSSGNIETLQATLYGHTD